MIYVGSGEANIRGNVAWGNGIYRSTDAGKTWQHQWKTRGQIGTMVVDPKNADVAYAAVLGSPFGPGEDRGVYRTTDGGRNWKKVLYRNAETGASDVALDPSNPRIVFAGLWQAQRRPWTMTSGGPGSGLFRSADGGDTWTGFQFMAYDGGEGFFAIFRPEDSPYPEAMLRLQAMAPDQTYRLENLLTGEKLEVEGADLAQWPRSLAPGAGEAWHIRR